MFLAAVYSRCCKSRATDPKDNFGAYTPTATDIEEDEFDDKINNNRGVSDDFPEELQGLNSRGSYGDDWDDDFEDNSDNEFGKLTIKKVEMKSISKR